MRSDAREKKAHIFEREPDNHYAEEPWSSAALFRFLSLPKGTRVHDPACGFGHVVASASTYGLEATGADIKPRWLYIGTPGLFELQDYLATPAAERIQAPWIVSNPPYGDGIEMRFLEAALRTPRTEAVAFLLPVRYSGGTDRINWLRSTPFASFITMGPRVNAPPGSVWLNGGKVEGGSQAFAWYLWRKGHTGGASFETILRDE